MNELKPCPFCGDKAIIIKSLGDYAVRCRDGCGARQAWFDSEGKAVEAWNRRVKQKEIIDAEGQSGSV